MFNMMSLLTKSIAWQHTRQKNTSLSTCKYDKEPKIKDPETFNGNCESLNSFFTKCELVFELQPSQFGDDHTRVKYMVSLLHGTPLLVIHLHVIAWPRPDFLEDFDLFIAYLRTNIGDPDEMGTARHKIKALQKTSLASAYFAEFQQYLAILGWKDQDPIFDRAIDSLKSNLKDEVACIGDQPTSLARLIAFVVPLDNRLHERDQEREQEIPVVASRPFEMRQNIGSEGPALSHAANTTTHVVNLLPTPNPTA